MMGLFIIKTGWLYHPHNDTNDKSQLGIPLSFCGSWVSERVWTTFKWDVDQPGPSPTLQRCDLMSPPVLLKTATTILKLPLNFNKSPLSQIFGYNHWNQKVGWIARGFPQQGFGPPASYYNIFFQLKTIFPIFNHLFDCSWIYLTLFAVGPPWGYQAKHSNTSCDKQMCFKSVHPRSSTFDNTRKYDNSWQLGSNSAADLGKVVVRLR